MPSGPVIDCNPPADSVAHLMRCPCLSSLREWFAAAWTLMGWPGNPDFTLAIVFGHAPRCGDRVALVALRGVVISIIRTIRYQVTQDGNTTPPGRRETRSRAAYLMRRHIQFDYEYVMMVTKDPPNQPANQPIRWRPKSRAHFMKRWEKMCTVAHGLLIFNELIRRTEESPPTRYPAPTRLSQKRLQADQKFGLGPPRGESRTQEGQITAKL